VPQRRRQDLLGVIEEARQRRVGLAQLPKQVVERQHLVAGFEPQRLIASSQQQCAHCRPREQKRVLVGLKHRPVTPHHWTQPVASIGRTDDQQTSGREHASDVIEKRRRVEGVFNDVKGGDDVELALVVREQRVDIAADDAPLHRWLCQGDRHGRQFDSRRLEARLECRLEEESRATTDVEEAGAAGVLPDPRQAALA